MSSRTTPIQEEEDDEDITKHDASPFICHGSITRARARQLNYQVNSFLSSTFDIDENRLLPNEAIIVRCEGKAYEELKNQPRSDQERAQAAGPRRGRAQGGGVQLEYDFESNSESLTSSPSN